MALRVEATTIREERASIWEQMKALSTLAEGEGRDLSAEEYKKYEALEADLDSKTRHLERVEKELETEGKLTRSVVAPAQDPEQVIEDSERASGVSIGRAAALVTRVHVAGDQEASEELRSLAHKAGVDNLKQRLRRDRTDHEARMLYAATDEYRDAWINHVRDVLAPGTLTDEQRAALNIGTSTQGGVTVPVEFYRQLVISERFFGSMRQLAKTIVTADNGAVTIPKVDDANRAVATWTAEAAAFTESEDAFLSTVLNAYKIGLVSKVSDELVLDSAFDILGFVAQSAGQAIGIASNTAYVTGASGSTTTPEGLFTKATVGYTLPTGNTTGITYAGLVELYHSVRPAYRSRGTFLGSDAALKVLRQLTDSQNRPLWEPSIQAGEPDTILGRPIIADPDVAVPAANALSLGFGDVNSAYWIRDVQDITAKVLNELYAATGQVGVRVHRRTDGDIVDTLAFKTLKNSAT